MSGPGPVLKCTAPPMRFIAIPSTIWQHEQWYLLIRPAGPLIDVTCFAIAFYDTLSSLPMPPPEAALTQQGLKAARNR